MPARGPVIVTRARTNTNPHKILLVLDLWELDGGASSWPAGAGPAGQPGSGFGKGPAIFPNVHLCNDVAAQAVCYWHFVPCCAHPRTMSLSTMVSFVPFSSFLVLKDVFPHGCFSSFFGSLLPSDHHHSLSLSLSRPSREPTMWRS